MKLIISRVSVVTCLCVCLARGATLANSPIAGPAPTATIRSRPHTASPGSEAWTQGVYLRPYLALRLQIRVVPQFRHSPADSAYGAR